MGELPYVVTSSTSTQNPRRLDGGFNPADLRRIKAGNPPLL